MKIGNRGSCRPALGLDPSRGGYVSEAGHDLSVVPDFGGRLRALVKLQGASLTTDELARVWANVPKCRGQEPWVVREYVGRIGAGAREYRVVRGSESPDVYRSAERVRAAAVGMALNELESQETARGSAEAGRIADPHE